MDSIVLGLGLEDLSSASASKICPRLTSLHNGRCTGSK